MNDKKQSETEQVCQIKRKYNKLTYTHIEAFDIRSEAKLKLMSVMNK